MSEAGGPAAELQANGNTRENVVISVCGGRYQLDGSVFATWQAREVAVSVASRTGQPYDQVLADVITAYIEALDQQAEAA